LTLIANPERRQPKALALIDELSAVGPVETLRQRRLNEGAHQELRLGLRDLFSIRHPFFDQNVGKFIRKKERSGIRTDSLPPNRTTVRNRTTILDDLTPSPNKTNDRLR